jgi:diguanylate cyclase (GGDEF)-like protein
MRVNWAKYLEPRDREEAKRTAATLFMVAAGVTLLFAVLVPPPGGPWEKLVPVLIPAVLIVLSLLLLRTGSSERRLLALWAPAPIVGILAIAGMDLATKDSSAAGQVFLCYPVIYAASQLKAPAAITACLAALAADAAVVFRLEALTPAFTDLCYVSAALLSMTALLIRAGKRQDALVLELRHQAAIDPLTGLATRRVLDDAARAALSSDDSDGGTALGIIDIDRFKSVNDLHGHPVGDAALVHIAGILAAHTRPDTVLCRIGGDEIAVLLPGCSLPVAMKRAESLVQAIRDNPMRLSDGQLLHLSVSIGVAHAPLPHDADTLRGLYAEADAALYNAKHAGRDQVGVPASAPNDQQSLGA